MKSEVISKGLSLAVAERVSRAVAVLREGGVVAYPTDTVYGLGADVYNDEAVARVYSIKSRPLNQPLPVLVADAAQAGPLAGEFPLAALRLIEKFWPGGLTIILDKSPEFSSLVLAGGRKVALRVPDNAAARSMIGALGRPVVGTSANLHGMPSTLTVREVRRQLGKRIDFVLAGGRCPGGRESTVIDMTVDPPAIVRQGVIPDSEILDLLKYGGS